MNTTTARFPRTSRGSPAQSAGSISGPFRRPLAERVARAIVWSVIGLIGCMAVVHWLAT
jgi:hypothetical protein